MITFISSVVVLIAGYFIYSKVVERIFGIDDQRPTPAYIKRDGLDYMPMGWVKAVLIQLLNIAGLGPIFGAIMGALYGPVAFIWIVVGCLFAGAVHDYFSGMLSIKHGGEQYPTLVGRYLGKTVKTVINVVSLVLMILVAAAFTAGPAQLVDQLTPLSYSASLLLIFIYFVLAAVLPVNKLIGKIYPIFGVILIIMAVSIGCALFFMDYSIPNITFENMHPGEIPIWPLLMVTISCGAISGFHSTQSPILARTLKRESDGRRVFFGAMVAEGVIALIWAAAGMTFFGGPDGLQGALAEGGAAGVVNEISKTTLGQFGGILAILGVIILPITTGDTALRSSRMMLVDLVSKFGSFDSKGKSILMTIPVVVPTYLLTQMDYTFLWRYVGWTNQVVATVMLWTAAMFLLENKKFHWIASLPALFMTAVTGSYIFYAPEGFQFSYQTSMLCGGMVFLAVTVWFIMKLKKQKQADLVIKKAA